MANIFLVLEERRLSPIKKHPALGKWIEEVSLASLNCLPCSLPENSKSTISVAISADGDLMASSHGDHSIKITNYPTGRLLKTYFGQERTPWTIKFHPRLNGILASGCLSGKVRIWDVQRDEPLMETNFSHPVRSLAFQTEDLLFVASGAQIFVWNFAQGEDPVLFAVTPSPISYLGFSNSSQGDFLVLSQDQRDKKRKPTLHLCPLTPSGIKFEKSFLVLENVDLHSDQGCAISRCGRKLAYCKKEATFIDSLYDRQIVIISLESNTFGVALYKIDIPSMKAFTSLDFSPCGTHLVVGSAVTNGIPEPTIFLIKLGDEEGYKWEATQSNSKILIEMCPKESINVVMFHPHHGNGFVYGTDKGRLKILTMA